MASKSTRAGSLALLLAGALALTLSACTSTMKDCSSGFAIISPKEGAVLQPGDVKVEMTPLQATFCTFAPKSYEVSVNGGAPVVVPGSEATPTAVLKNLGPGNYTATAVARDARGKALAQCATKFSIVAPPPTPPAPAVVAPPPTPPEAPKAEEIVSEAGKYLKDIFFDFDKSEIRADQTAALDADAKWLRDHTVVGVTVEGHCDERGTREYNLALGERRANAVRDALVALGVDPAQIKTISYGKERPFCTETPKEAKEKEECWQANRRGHFVPAVR
jgi:peptidoglycan-associated lipoprotein